ncbi:hypothetical protein [Falsiroseomonas sp.]|uniref:hypothetical protein n=1 Tax=Falsiroseomonas sp. TaxID=2870721 RepID=UPI0034A4FF80
MKTSLSLPGRPEIGSVALVQHQRFECVEIRPHVTRTGRDVELSIWIGRCADCGAPFDLVTPRRAGPVRVDRRRCAEHRDPKRRVKVPAGASA